MKKFIAMFTAVLSFLLLSVPVTAAQGQNGNIGTTVPTEHSVSIEAEHAFALYTEGSKGQSAAYLVPRFSEPEFELSVEDGYSITRVLVNGQDVTAQLTDGMLKLSSVNKDQTITVETKKNTEQPEKPEDPKDTEQPDKPQNPDSGNSGSDNTNNAPQTDNLKQDSTTDTAPGSADTGDMQSTLLAMLLTVAGASLLVAGVYKKRMKD